MKSDIVRLDIVTGSYTFLASSLIQKLRKSSCLVSQDIPALWPLLKGFFFEKEGFRGNLLYNKNKNLYYYEEVVWLFLIYI